MRRRRYSWRSDSVEGSAALVQPMLARSNSELRTWNLGLTRNPEFGEGTSVPERHA